MNLRTEKLLQDSNELFSKLGNEELGLAIGEAEKIGDKFSFRFKEATTLQDLYISLAGNNLPANAKPVEVKLPEIEPVEVKLPEIEPVEVKLPEIEPVEVKLPEIEPVEVKLPEIEPPDVYVPHVEVAPKYIGIKQIGRGWGSDKDGFSVIFSDLNECAKHFNG